MLSGSGLQQPASLFPAKLPRRGAARSLQEQEQDQTTRHWPWPIAVIATRPATGAAATLFDGMGPAASALHAARCNRAGPRPEQKDLVAAAARRRDLWDLIARARTTAKARTYAYYA